MSRFYCPQFCSLTAGWVDLPSLASKKEKEAIKNLMEWRENKSYGLQTRVIRKSHGWEPPTPITESKSVGMVDIPFTPEADTFPIHIPRMFENISDEVVKATIRSMWIETEKPSLADAIDGKKLQEFYEKELFNKKSLIHDFF